MTAERSTEADAGLSAGFGRVPTAYHGGGDACDLCGGPTFEVRCKIVCRRCGFTRDCSDP